VCCVKPLEERQKIRHQGGLMKKIEERRRQNTQKGGEDEIQMVSGGKGGAVVIQRSFIKTTNWQRTRGESKR